MASEQFSETEVARRLPVWCALSDAFLDTELDAQSYQHIADIIRAQGYSRVEAEAIFRTEVAPAFAVNLWSVAGEWQGWSEDYVRDRVLNKRGSTFARFATRLFNKRLLASEWAKVAAFLDH